MADPTKEAAPAAPKAPKARVCAAISTTVSSGMTTTAPTAAARDPSPRAERADGGMVTAEANSGKAPGASSTTFGSKGRSSGVAASTRIKISLFSAARARRGSNFERESPASWALERSPDWATLVKRPEASTSSRRVLTAILFPTASTWLAKLDRRLTPVCATGAGAKALVQATKSPESEK